MAMLILRVPRVFPLAPTVLLWRSRFPNLVYDVTVATSMPLPLLYFSILYRRNGVLSFCSSSQNPTETTVLSSDETSKGSPLKSGLYLVATPIGNLEDITLRALRILRSADVILSEDTRHSGKLLQHYNIKTPLLSYHKFNESQREKTILRRLQQGDVVALISDAGSPVGFLPKQARSRREKLQVCADETATQIFFVPPHKLHQFLEETSSFFSDSRQCVIAREITKLHEEFWQGTLGEAKAAFSTHQPKGEITLLIEGKAKSIVEAPSEAQLECELRDLISHGHSLSTAVKLVSEGTSVKRKTIYSLALRKFGKPVEAEDDSNQDN
ncbi:PREDICTED: uncharacterized protein LOC104595599 isoform X3 [Nelumbo nucifera]|uniref:Uncharacterized protein LOC104595599 isoform X3 n=1 Tax=Nelumbo nucifera TaxID=4432 RepID=A0A1U7ZKW7_NELNU|nr:PREDICTED: uncharacterized protein LOC104595599 isoform X3 [Nelumbo nucifera]